MGRDHQGSVPHRPVETEPQRSLMQGGPATLKRLHVKRPDAAFPNWGASGLFEMKFVSRHTIFRDKMLSIFLLYRVKRASVNGFWKSSWPGKGGRVNARVGR